MNRSNITWHHLYVRIVRHRLAAPSAVQLCGLQWCFTNRSQPMTSCHPVSPLNKYLVLKGSEWSCFVVPGLFSQGFQEESLLLAPNSNLTSTASHSEAACSAALIWHRSFVSVCLQDVSGMSLSMLAAAGGQDDILRLLIKKGVRVNGRQKNGTTALMHAAEKVTQPLACPRRLITLSL